MSDIMTCMPFEQMLNWIRTLLQRIMQAAVSLN